MQPVSNSGIGAKADPEQAQLFNQNHPKSPTDSTMSEQQTRLQTAGAASRIAVAALSLVVSVLVEDLPLQALLQLRATCRHLCTLITGHMPAGLVYRVYVKKGRIQVGR